MPSKIGSKKPKILLFDIETMANKAFVWGKYEQDVLSFESHWYMLSFAWKWFGEKQAHVIALPDFIGYKKDKQNDKSLVHYLWELFNSADIVVGHNCDGFDIKRANARFLFHGILPPAPFKSVDTLKVARKYYKFDSNKLDDLGGQLGIGRKVVHTGWDLWLGCAVRDEKKSWEMMKKYNKQDVLLLEKIYLKLRPWINNHPNHNVYIGENMLCPNCGSKDLIKQGCSYNRTTVRQQFSCKKCGAWSSKPLSENSIIR